MQVSNRTFIVAALVVCLGAMTPSLSYAQSSLRSATPNQEGAKAGDKQSGDSKQEEPKRPKEALDYEKAVKDLEKFDGAFTLYKRKKDILLELPESMLGKVFFLQATLASGIGQQFQAGDPLNWGSNDAFYFQRMDDQVMLVRPNLKYRWDAADPLAEASNRSFPKAYLADYRIEQTNPETKKILVNVTSFFTGELQSLPVLATLMGGASFSLDRDKSRVGAIYSNGNMTVVRMDQHYTSQRNLMSMMEDNPLAALFGMTNQLEDSRSMPLQVNYTLWFQDDKDNYRPRLADPRVGYFTQDFYSVDRFFKTDRTQRYIMRWNLEKKDPKAPMSEPVKPIVWTLDSSIPEKWRPAVRDGVLRWNKAFEAIGYKNAVQVVDAPKDDKNYNHADGTRNVIRFTMTEDAGYAVALFRTNPFTGEIQNASVTVDANFTSAINSEYLRLGIPTTSALQKTVDIARKGLTSEIPADQPTAKETLLDTFKYKAARNPAIRKTGWATTECDYGSKVMADAAMNFRTAASVGLNMTADEYVSGYLSDVVAHEVGHCMGLRHNFVASTTLSTAELGDPKCVGEYGVASSVMDYTPTNMVALLSKQKDLLWNKGVNTYDMFAIEYGYSDVGAGTTDGERFGLGQIARKSGLKGYGFMTDEDADTFNPFVVRFDSGSDPLNYMAKENLAYRKMRSWAIANLPRNGESYAERNNLILGTMVRQISNGMGASMFIGGVVANRQFRGDANERPNLTPVDSAMQRQALGMIVDDVLKVSSVDVPESVLNSMALDFNDGSGSTFTAPIRALLSQLQISILGELISVNKGQAILENEFKMGSRSDRYTLAEHYTGLVNAVFGDVGPAKSVAPLRQELQNFFLDALMAQAASRPGALTSSQRNIADSCIGKIEARLKGASGSDAATASHFEQMMQRIKRFEAREAVTPF